MTESKEFKDTVENLVKDAAELGLFVSRYTPDREKLVTHLETIADEMEKIHRVATEQKVFGSAAGILGAGVAIGGTLAAAPVAIGIGAFVQVTGLGVKLTSSGKERMQDKWKEVKRAIERDSEAWHYVKNTIKEIIQLVERNERLLAKKKHAIPVGLAVQFERVKDQVGVVIMHVKVAWLHLPENEPTEAVLQALACLGSTIMAVGGTRMLVEQVPVAGAGGVKKYAGNAAKTNPLSLAAKISVTLNVISAIIDAHDIAMNWEQLDSQGENAIKLREMAQNLKKFFEQNETK